jgi:hypothetical protein
MLKKTYVRDGKNRVIGPVTIGFEGSFETPIMSTRRNLVD